ncbi:Gfo/Idh/MocA family protein [Paenibacillus psychroresistens]
MLKVGVIGCGAIAQRRHLPEYLQRNDVEIIAVCDFNLQRAQEVAKQFGAKYAFQTHEELLACEEIEAVSVCAPNNLHASISIEALNAGKHVLCEKPMATNLAEAKSMIEAAQINKVKLMIGHSQRFMAVHTKAKEIIEQGKLGKVLSFQSNFSHSGPENWSVDGSKSWFFNKDEAFAGVLGDLGIHKADLIRWLLDDEVSELTSMYGTQHKNTNVDDHAVILMKTRKGAIGTITASWVSYPNEINSTVIFCEKGTISIGVDPSYGLIVDHSNKQRELHELGKIQSNEVGEQFTSGVIDHFVDGIVNGTGHLITGEEGYKSLEIVLAGINSANSKTTVIFEKA